METPEGALARSTVDIGVGQRDVVMKGALWGKLPKELIRCVCARLPLPKLLSVQCSVMEENWRIDLHDSEFRQMCAETHTSMCAMMVPTLGSMGVYNLEVSRGEPVFWTKLNLPSPEHADLYCERSYLISSADGGLLCFALRSKSPENEEPIVVIVVMNPLTGECKELPAHGLSPVQLMMLELVVDRETKLYQVILAGLKSGQAGARGETEAMLYDAGTGVWTNARGLPRLFYGTRYCFLGGTWDTLKDVGPCAYDCAAEKFYSLDRYVLWRTHRLSEPFLDAACFDDRPHLDAACLHDRLLMLDREDEGARHGQSCRLSQYQIQLQEGKVSFLKLDDHHEIPTDLLEQFCVRLWVCKGFMLVTGMRSPQAIIESRFTVSLVAARLCNWSTGDWHEVEGLGTSVDSEGWHFQAGFTTGTTRAIQLAQPRLCELKWDAVP
ncbi:hypothetical protein M758_4G223600 [Ceratodon purpureus]|nr:hypothetical protein M758_4G223600 [Ceratodon purpureus]